ncbi:uncharacterized protein LOC112679415 isoform X2 [Sipha flava]|uniref:Uncharacterized protein LOC112679415 isoform X2 n=1 Tax=Sipha flava TaxID=143950 RepID=A0A8B8F2I7_9HEMI|nr:uncharacterized protein LOC112679415 isoform X2 [Sipha flava]
MNKFKFLIFFKKKLTHLERKMNTEIVQPFSQYSLAEQNINNSKHNIIWFDGEMTGLDVNKHTLIEAAIIVTDGNLKILAESSNIIIHQPDEILENMEEWPLKQHTLSGLIENVKKSNISIEQADQMLYDFIKPFAPKGMCPLAGNSIYMDRTFIKKYMPKLESQLSYRLIDVSTLKELFKYGLNIILILINNTLETRDNK